MAGRRLGDVGRRMLAAAFMLLHAAAVGFVPIADAQLERDADYTVHIESDDRPACPRHDHLQCQLCRVADVNVLATGDIERPTNPLAQTAAAVTPEPSCFASTEPWLPLGARAPPLV